MAYEYEDKVVNILKNLGALYNSNINFRMAEEVEDVYYKANKSDNYMSQIEEYAQGARDIDDMIKKKNK